MYIVNKLKTHFNNIKNQTSTNIDDPLGFFENL